MGDEDGGRLAELERRLAALRVRVREGYVDRARALRAQAERLQRGEEDARTEIRRLAHRVRGIAEEAPLIDRAAALEERAIGADAAIAIAEALALADALEQPAEEPPSAPTPAPVPVPIEKLGWRVLAVDDEPSTRRLLQLTLTNLGGCDARIAGDAQSALAVLEEGGLDLVVLDAMMPDCDGLQLYREVRARLGSSTPVVILSATGAMELGWKLPDDPRLQWMRKPFRPASLMAALRAFVERAAAASTK